MKTVADPVVLQSLVARLELLQPGASRRWGSLTANEMLCHLGDAAAMVLRTRPRLQPMASRERRLLKGLGLWSPIRWPHGWATNPQHDPKAAGTRPSDFGRDRARAVDGLRGIAGAAP